MRFILLSFFLTGCLTTRAELREQQEQKTNLQDQVSTMQQTHAQEVVREQEYDEQIRVLNGRVDQAENKVVQLQTALQKQTELHGKDESNDKFKAYEEALVKMESQVAALNAELDSLKKPSAAPKVDKNGFQDGEDAFNAKEYKEAIVIFQRYREKNPKGKKFAEASLKIGMAFKELGMTSESKTFLEEVVEKYPSSPEAKKAKSLLKARK